MSALHGVVVCPRCRSAKGCKVGQKTTTCRCGHVIDLRGVRYYLKTTDLRELAKNVATVNAKLGGGHAEFKMADNRQKKRGGVHDRIAGSAAKESSREDVLTAVAVQLTKEFGTFSRNDIAKVLNILGVANVQRAIETLLESNIIHETKPGRYKSV